LSIIDAGFYGKGIYFSTTAIYTLPYFGTRKNPALIISWLLPGNVYPVIEVSGLMVFLFGPFLIVY
jgi:hypothetical protein